MPIKVAQFKTNQLGLALTHTSEDSMTFLEWRTLINGVGCDSNMELIDKAIATLIKETGGMADGLKLDSDTGLLQLTHHGEPIEDASAVLNLNNHYTKAEVDAQHTGFDERITQNSNDCVEIKNVLNDIDFSVTDLQTDQQGHKTVNLSLTVGKETFSYDIKIDSSLSSNALSSAMTDIARLTVDRLSTSRKIPKYLAQDMSDINYVDIRDRRIAMVRAWTDGSTVQATNSNGQKLWWEKNIAGAEIGDDGYPYIDDSRVQTVTYDTGDINKVIIYHYQEGDRWLQTTDESNNFGPIQVWGEGDGTDTGIGRGYIEKLGLSFDLYNYGTDGIKKGIFIGDDYLDFVGRRKTELIRVNKDSMTIGLQGGVSYGYTFGYDENGQLISMTDNEGHVITLELEASDE